MRFNLSDVLGPLDNLSFRFLFWFSVPPKNLSIKMLNIILIPHESHIESKVGI